ncbi:hypothetical protein B0A48_04763 [Cryoendolithus antarcticus]|uniref:Uncharacterized protein n=1 Tax=Cryoendolithus antarcticus TaxID=1507870 RepID=A0A1V8TDB7_9PEZI|nr:hypothetical protein B0A48_04763 [Cryoendolithus antarcticus]
MPLQRSRDCPSPRASSSSRLALEIEDKEDKEAEDDEDYVDDGASEDDDDDEDDGDADSPVIRGKRNRPRVQKSIRQRKRKRAPSPEVASPKKPRTAPEILEDAIMIADNDDTPNQPAPPSPGRTLLSYPPPQGTNLTLAADFPRYDPQVPHIRVA